MLLHLPTRTIDCSSRRPLIMGIVNINDDSFSGDGTLDICEAIEITKEKILSGADIIDVGAESAGTNRKAISIEEEISRFETFLEAWESCVKDLKPKDENQVWPPILSANTWRTQVVEKILNEKIEILNDISALPDAENAKLCAKNKTALLIMHSIGTPKVPNTEQIYENFWNSLESFFEEKIRMAIDSGLKEEQIIIDPGIDFAKQTEHSLSLLRESHRLLKFDRPILLPISRKTVIGDVLGITEVKQRDAGTIACLVQGYLQGAHIFRVHNVEATWKSLKMLESIHS